MANNKIKGLTVEIGGETTKLSEALSEVDKNGYKLQGNLKEVEKLLKLDPTNTELLAERQKILAESVENSEKKLEQLKSVQDQITAQYQSGEIDRGAYLAFQRELITTENQLESLNNSISDTGNEAEQAAGKMDDINAGSINVATAAVKVGVKAFAAYSAAIGAAGTAAFKLAADAGAMADDINTLAKVTGMSTEQLQIYSLYSAQVDVDTETIAKAMQKLTVNMGDAADGSASATAKFDKLGISVKDVNGNLKSNDEVFAEALDKLAQMENETERDAAAMDLFGKSAQELNPLILGGADAFRDMGEAAKANGLILSQEALDSLNEFNDSIDDLKTNVTGAGNVLAGSFAPKFQVFTDIIGDGAAGIITDVAAIFSGEALDGTALTNKLSEMGTSLIGAIEGFLPGFVQGFNTVFISAVDSVMQTLPTAISSLVAMISDNLVLNAEAGTRLFSVIAEAVPEVVVTVAEAVPEIVEAIVDTLSSAVPTIIDTGFNLLTALVDSLPKIISTITKKIPDIITGITGIITKSVPKIAEAGTKLFSSLADSIPEVVVTLTQAVPQIITSVVSVITESVPVIMEAGITLLTSLVGALPDIIVTIVEALPQIITGIIEALVSAIPQLIETGVNLFVSLIEALPDIIITIVEAIPQIITGIIDTLIEAVPQLIEAGITLFISLVEALPEIITAIVEAVPQIIESLITTLIDATPQLIEAGITLFISLISELPTIIKTIVEAVPKIIDGLVDGFASFGGSMLNIGKNLIEGIWNGISNAKDWLVEKISGFFDGIVDYIKEFFGIASPSKLFRDDVGKYLAQGIGVGFEGEMGAVTKQMQAALPTKFDTDVTLGGGLQSTAQGFGAATKNVTYTQNIYSPKALSRAEIAANTRSMLQLANMR